MGVMLVNQTYTKRSYNYGLKTNLTLDSTSSQGEKGNISQSPYEKLDIFSRSKIIPGNCSPADPII